MEDPFGPTREVVFLDYETVVGINHLVAPQSGGVRDRSMIEGAVARPQMGFGGVDAHGTLLHKVAALIHGLASTQGFHDGNKRTAWMAAQAMLAANSLRIHQVSDVTAEAIMLGVAGSFVTVDLLAQWLSQIVFPFNFAPSVTIQGGSVEVSALQSDGLIEGFLLIDAIVHGPAILRLEPPLVARMCNWTMEGRRPDDVMLDDLLDPELRPNPAGIITVRNVGFVRCTFSEIGFTASAEMMAAIFRGSTTGEPGE